ncbi:MAG TPA: hypothetical protein VE549_16825 [Myxococcaceae bacterium]|jgi:hypothetical protein|nr:hypothetical protein [Myxococcaceae bacterium]
MTRNIAYLVPIAALAFSACGASRQQTRASDALDDTVLVSEKISEDDLVCGAEKPTGTNIRKEICRTRARIEAEQAAADQFVQRIRNPRASHR